MTHKLKKTIKLISVLLATKMINNRVKIHVLVTSVRSEANASSMLPAEQAEVKAAYSYLTAPRYLIA